MKANSRSSIRWGVATAVVALALGALPATFDVGGITGKAALAGAGGNGKLVATAPKAPSDDDAMGDEEEKVPPPSDLAGDADDTQAAGTDQHPANEDDSDRIGDDSDVASVEGSANDDDTADTNGNASDKTF